MEICRFFRTVRLNDRKWCIMVGMQFFAQNWGIILLFLYLGFWVVVSFSMLVSTRAKEYFASYFPQWFRRDGRPFTTREKIGAGTQGVTLLLILYILFV